MSKRSNTVLDLDPRLPHRTPTELRKRSEARVVAEALASASIGLMRRPTHLPVGFG